jgi:two-component system, NtrC family, sensor histidine kinase HydH
LGQMAAGLAHEVKNPLGAIKGAAQLLSEDRAGLHSTEHEFLDIILEEVERLDRVVGSVLDYARPSKGDLGAVDVNAVVRRTLRVLSSARADVPEVVSDLADDLPPARADAEQLRQVLMNLIRNASQAMSGRGTIHIATRSREERAAGAAPKDANRFVEISVRDQGPGIAPQVLKNLFEPFFTTKERGTGLGLAISQRVVGDMGGRIEVATKTGAGATFTVVLPISTEPLAHDAVRESAERLAAAADAKLA